LNPGPRGVQSAFVHVRSRITQPTGFDRFGGRPISRFSRSRRPEHRRDPALVMTPFRYQNYLSVGRLYCFLGSESDCIVVCNWYGPILERVGCLHTQTGLQSPRRNRSPPKGCGSAHHSYAPAQVKPARGPEAAVSQEFGTALHAHAGREAADAETVAGHAIPGAVLGRHVVPHQKAELRIVAGPEAVVLS
jgi:hypothetical protein